MPLPDFANAPWQRPAPIAPAPPGSGLGDAGGHRGQGILRPRRHRRSPCSREHPRPAAVPARPLPHHVRRAAVDDPPVRRLLHGARFQRLLPAQPRRRAERPLRRLRSPHPSRLRFRRSARCRRCRHGGRRHRFHPRHGGAFRRHPARRDDRVDDDERRRPADHGALHRRGRAPGREAGSSSPARSRTTS